MRRKGFTLIEVLIAMLVGAMVVIGAFQLLGNTSIISERQRAFRDHQIAAQEVVLMFQADIEASESVMRGGRRYLIIRENDEFIVSLVRNGATPDGEPGLVAVEWSFGKEGIERWAGSRFIEQLPGFKLVEKSVNVRPLDERSAMLGFPVWQLRIGGLDLEVWIPNA